MNLFRLSYIMLTATAVLTGCSSADSDISDNPYSEPVAIRLRICCSSAASRAATPVLGTDAENMYSWVVYLCSEDGTIQYRLSNTDNDADNHVGNGALNGVLEDTYPKSSYIEVPSGAYNACSFANFDPGYQVGEKLDWATLTAKAQGNGFDASKTHIPMSNIENLSIVSNNATHDLHVTRMISKLDFQVENQTGVPITIKSISISDITDNGEDIPLLPTYTSRVDWSTVGTSTLVPCMTDFDRLAQYPAVSDFGFSFSAGLTLADKATSSHSTYINESATPANQFGEYIITVALERTQGKEEQMRYALVSNDNSEWNYIARNDWRIIPIVLKDYKLDIVPLDWPPIGVFPASVKDEDGLFTVTFHSGGHFHLQPVISSYSGATVDNYQITSFTLDTDATGDTETHTNAFYYEPGDGSNIDGSDNGGAPVIEADKQFVFGKLKAGVKGNIFYTMTVDACDGAGNVLRTFTYHLCLIANT